MSSFHNALKVFLNPKRIFKQTEDNLMKKKLKVLSLFSGSMGLDLGLEKTGKYEIIATVEVDHACCETMRLNKKNGLLSNSLTIYEQDIVNLDPLQILYDLNIEADEIDVIAGGPPCQAFSTAGKRKSVADHRGTLLWQFLRFVNTIQPKFFLMENVRGLMSASLKHRPISERPNKGGAPLTPEEEPGSVVNAFVNDLQQVKGTSYHLDIFEVNSVNYGAPQIRERVLFIGNKLGIQVDFPDPTHAMNQATIDDEIQTSLFDDSQQLQPWKTIRNAIGDLKEDSPEILDFSPRKKHFLSMVPEGGNWRSLPEEEQKDSMGKAFFAKGGRSGWWRRLTYDLPSPTLVTMPNHSSTSLCHPTETRALSVREYARIQEFPDNWEFAGKISEKYKQIGNAVPLRLGEVAGTVIEKALDDFPNNVASPDTPIYRVIYIQSHVRTRKWVNGQKAVIWDNTKEGHYSKAKTKRKITNLK